jgi:hypothetical protein
MKRFAFWTGVAVIAVLVVLAVGCSSPMEKAQKLFNEGKYQEVIAQYGNDPNVAAVVTQAKEKLAAAMLSAGKYDSVLVLYPETAAAKEAHNKLAEQLFKSGNFAEVLAKYGDTPWAVQAKAELDKQQSATTPGGKPGQPAVSAATEKAAQVEFDRIMKIKMKDLRTKSLKEFAAKAEFAGTKAVQKAQQELGK